MVWVYRILFICQQQPWENEEVLSATTTTANICVAMSQQFCCISIIVTFILSRCSFLLLWYEIFISIIVIYILSDILIFVVFYSYSVDCHVRIALCMPCAMSERSPNSRGWRDKCKLLAMSQLFCFISAILIFVWLRCVHDALHTYRQHTSASVYVSIRTAYVSIRYLYDCDAYMTHCSYLIRDLPAFFFFGWWGRVRGKKDDWLRARGRGVWSPPDLARLLPVNLDFPCAFNTF